MEPNRTTTGHVGKAHGVEKLRSCSSGWLVPEVQGCRHLLDLTFHAIAVDYTTIFVNDHDVVGFPRSEFHVGATTAQLVLVETSVIVKRNSVNRLVPFGNRRRSPTSNIDLR